MKSKLLLSLSLFLLASHCYSQITFQRTIRAKGSSTAYAVEQTSDGGYIIGGYAVTPGTTGYDAYLVKTNAQGDTLWTKTYGGTDFDLGFFVQQTADGGYIIAGSTTSPGQAPDIYVIKTNATGDTLWSRAYGDALTESGYFVQQTADNGYIVAGSTYSFGAGGADAYLLKLNAQGDTLWTKTYGDVSTEEAECVKQTSDGGYIFCGYTFSYGAGGADVYLVKTNASGDTLWTKTYGGTGNEAAYSVAQTTDGGYIVAGYTNSFGAGNYDYYLIKTNSTGDTLWTRTYGGTGDDEGYSVQQTGDGGYVISGYTNSFGEGNYDAYIVKIAAASNVLWSKTYGGTGSDGGFSVRQTADGGYIIGGNSSSFFPGKDSSNVYLIKTDANGVSGCNEVNPSITVHTAATHVGTTNSTVSSGCTPNYTATIVGSVGNDSALCLVNGIEELTIISSISIYPNPSADQITIAGNWKENKNLSLTIFNILGETIYTATINSKSSTCGINSFPSGVYFVTVADENGQWVGRFVKE